MAVRFADVSARSVAGFSPTAGPSVGLVAALSGSALVMARLLDPSHVDAGPVRCPFRLVTGLPCPGCGLTRSWVHLMHGQVGEAMAANPFGLVALVLAVALATAVATAVVRRQPLPSYAQLLGGRRRRLSILGLAVAWVGFGLVRMLAAVV